MATSNQLAAGMTISLNGRIYRVESCVKVTAAKGVPFVKAKLKDIISDEMVEKSFKLGQPIQDVSLEEKRLEFLYLEGKDYLFLDIGQLEQVLVPAKVIADKVQYLKEGVEIKAMFYGPTIFAIELPQFLELMIARTEEGHLASHVANATKWGILETGARVEVPLFVEAGDVIKVDTQTGEYIQRV
jgi:elongation factor P